jgi:hypothetical protein
MKFSAKHPEFGKIRFDGERVRVQNDSLAEILNRLMKPEEYEKLGLAAYNPDLTSRLLTLLRYLGLEEKLHHLKFEPVGPERPRGPHEPPRPS